MTSTKFNPRIYWTYEDTEVFEVSYQAVVDIASANPCFAFESQLEKLEVGSYLLVAMCWAEGRYAVSMGDAIANNYDAAQDFWKMATAGNYLNYVCDERNCYVCEYEIWHVVENPVENTDDEPNEPSKFDQMCALVELLQEFDGVSAEDVQAFCEGYTIGAMAVAEAMNFG